MHREEPLTINYTEEYVQLLKQHNNNMTNEDYSIQSLNTISCVLYHCPTNYTVWVDRRKVLEEIPREVYSFEQELVWTKKQAVENMKNYQVWHHLKYVLSKVENEISEDLDILEIVRKDTKNIHFWGVFLACTKNVESALEYTKYFIEIDVRNNSAYSIRHTLIIPLLRKSTVHLNKEKDFLLSLPILKHNLAFWNYVMALDKEFPACKLLELCEAAMEAKQIPKYYED
ncbi:protein farnesyltransferase/geranylgeranyltransferase type-1 subunit alpha [Nematocida sp. AWRm79]|nr:protein farnesyltransferase/geranylgeranyltransferase type-1 subunit alpha [Nematocida sp. AWRm79]